MASQIGSAVPLDRAIRIDRPAAIRRALALTVPSESVCIDEAAPASHLVSTALGRRALDLLHYEVLIRLRADPEDVHRARSSVRKLRAILRGFRPFLDRAWADTLREELRWLAGELGTVRDIDVALAALRSRAESVSHADVPYVAQTLEPLAEAREAARKRLLETLDGHRYRALLETIERAAAEPHFADGVVPPAGEVARETLRKTCKRARNAVKAAGVDQAPNELHHARITVRNGRYAAEACELVCGRPASRLARRLTRMQDVLGAINDAAFVQDRLRSTLADDPRTSLVAGQLLALEAVEGDKARRRWKSLRRRALCDWLELLAKRVAL